jgi:hypothetical protein
MRQKMLTLTWRVAFLGLALSTNPSDVQSSRSVFHSSHGSFFFLASTGTSIVIAADSRVTNSGAPDSKTDKLMPLGNTGVCFIGGDSSVWTLDGNGKFDKLDYEKTIRDWIKANPTATLPNAHESIEARLMALMKAFRRKHPGAYAESETPFSYFVCVGYYMGLQQFYASLYTATPYDVADKPDNPNMPVGHFRTFGWAKVCTEVIEGPATRKLSQFKSDPVVVKYRKAVAADNFSSVSTEDLLRLSRVCLEATESPAGSKFDANAKNVGPPNHYAVIDQREGFKSVNRR